MSWSGRFVTALVDQVAVEKKIGSVKHPSVASDRRKEDAVSERDVLQPQWRGEHRSGSAHYYAVATLCF